ncbi:MAG: hypothetical protein PVJ19_20185, partial [Desulfobacteraceae bacterium]
MEETDKTKCCCNSPEGPTLFLEETSKCKISVHHRSGRLCRIDIGQRRFKAAVKNKAIVLRIFMVSVLLASMMVWELAFAASSEKVPVNAGEAVEAFEKALQTFDFKKIQESVRLIQANPDAMHLIEQNPALHKRFEEERFVLSK